MFRYDPERYALQMARDLAQRSVNIIKAPGPMQMPSDETGERESIASIDDPDGYRIELIQAF